MFQLGEICLSGVQNLSVIKLSASLLLSSGGMHSGSLRGIPAHLGVMLSISSGTGSMCSDARGAISDQSKKRKTADCISCAETDRFVCV